MYFEHTDLRTPDSPQFPLRKSNLGIILPRHSCIFIILFGFPSRTDSIFGFLKKVQGHIPHQRSHHNWVNPLSHTLDESLKYGSTAPGQGVPQVESIAHSAYNFGFFEVRLKVC